MANHAAKNLATIPAGTLFAGIDLSLDDLIVVVLSLCWAETSSDFVWKKFCFLCRAPVIVVKTVELCWAETSSSIDWCPS